MQQTFYYLNITVLLICATDDEVCRLRNKFCKIKYIVFKIKILTVLLLSGSFGNVIYDIAASSNGLLSTTDIRSLEKCYKKREKPGLDITFLKNCRTLNIFPKFIHLDIPFSNGYDVTYIKKRILKNALHKRDK